MRGKAWHLNLQRLPAPSFLPERPGAGRSASRGVTHVSLPGDAGSRPHSPARPCRPAGKKTAHSFYLFPVPQPPLLTPAHDSRAPTTPGHAGRASPPLQLSGSLSPQSLSTPQHQLCFEIIHLAPVIQMLGLRRRMNLQSLVSWM